MSEHGYRRFRPTFHPTNRFRRRTLPATERRSSFPAPISVCHKTCRQAPSKTTAKGPAAGSFMMPRLRSHLPRPPTQASAQSARPSRCRPPANQTQRSIPERPSSRSRYRQARTPAATRLTRSKDKTIPIGPIAYRMRQS
jgi:hypothetical protein